MSYQEERHLTLIRRWIFSPTLFQSSGSSGSGADSILLSFSGTSKPLSAIAPDDLRDFYYKDCMVYLHTAITMEKRLSLLDAIYSEWFPHRDRVQDFARGSFFAGFLKSKHGDYRGGDSLQQLAQFHFGALCPKLKELEPEVLETDLSRFHPDFGKPKPKGRFRMNESFDKAFLVLDKVNWEQEGMLVVCRDARLSKELEGFGEELESERFGEAKVFRAKLESVMRALVADDPERSKRSREWSDLYDEWFGEGDEA